MNPYRIRQADAPTKARSTGAGTARRVTRRACCQETDTPNALGQCPACAWEDGNPSPIRPITRPHAVTGRKATEVSR